MLIGIDASRAFQKERTGIEEYSYQVIKHLRDNLKDDSSSAKFSESKQVILYCNPAVNDCPDFKLPKNWKVKFLRAPLFWTQVRLSLEMLFRPVDVLFIPAHTVPVIYSSKTVVVVHGLEYEFCPQAYSFFERLYMRWSIRNSCRWAKKIIAVSENTKKDLMRLYGVPEKKIKVIYEGINDQIPNLKSQSQIVSKFKIQNLRFLLFVGRLEERKNICGIIEAFEILKEKYNLPHKLVLAGKFGYGEETIKNKIERSKYEEDIALPGFVSDEEKFKLMKKAEVFLFPTFYEGFGLPILEAQSMGTPVVTSSVSSMPEVVCLSRERDDYSAVLVDPKNPLAIAEAVYKLISDENYKNDIIEKGLENVKRFSWEKCAGEIAEVISNL